LKNLTDHSLIANVQEGKVEAMGLLYERYKRLLYSFFYQMTKDSAWSEDLVQMVFYRMLKYNKQFNGSGSFKSWMFSIARNVLTDGFRKKKKRSDAFNVATSEKTLIEDNEADHGVIENERNRILSDALNRLDEETKELIIMIKLNEMKYREVAEILNMNESTIKVKVFRGIKLLQSLYSKVSQ
jgi:RNA polymerase sigma-70 factor (ECF subfamily)